MFALCLKLSRSKRALLDGNDGVQANFKVPPVWFVAENFRFEEAFVEASRIMPRLGFLLKLDLVADTPLNARCVLLYPPPLCSTVHHLRTREA